MRTRRLAAATATVLACASAASPAAAQEACEDRFFPDRPGATNSHATVGFGCAHLDSSLLVTRGPEATTFSLPHLVRVGFAHVAELRLGYDFFSITDYDADVATEVAPSGVLVEVKLMGAQADGRVPGVGATAGVSVPGDAASSHTVSPSTALLFDWSFVDAWGLALNLVLTGPPSPGPERRSVRMGYGAVLSYAPPVPDGWLSVYVDGAGGAVVEGGGFEQSVGAGAAFLLQPNFHLDLSFAVTVTGDDHPVSFGPGLAWRL